LCAQIGTATRDAYRKAYIQEFGHSVTSPITAKADFLDATWVPMATRRASSPPSPCRGGVCVWFVERCVRMCVCVVSEAPPPLFDCVSSVPASQTPCRKTTSLGEMVESRRKTSPRFSFSKTAR
jgi:hypothetical protein